jgi:hypothetical protein
MEDNMENTIMFKKAETPEQKIYFALNSADVYWELLSMTDFLFDRETETFVGKNLRQLAALDYDGFKVETIEFKLKKLVKPFEYLEAYGDGFDIKYFEIKEFNSDEEAIKWFTTELDTTERGN